MVEKSPKQREVTCPPQYRPGRVVHSSRPQILRTERLEFCVLGVAHIRLIRRGVGIPTKQIFVGGGMPKKKVEDRGEI